jgi:hypothetical protein
VVHLAIHPCGKPQGILAKANKEVAEPWYEQEGKEILGTSLA